MSLRCEYAKKNDISRAVFIKLTAILRNKPLFNAHLKWPEKLHKTRRHFSTNTNCRDTE